MTIIPSSIPKIYFFRCFFVSISLFFVAVIPTSAQQTTRIAALVNNEIITVRDIESRMQILFVASNLKPTKSVIKRLGNQVLRILVDEKLKLEAAAKYRIVVTETEFLDAVATLEKDNKISPGGFREYLRRKGIDWDAMSNQIRAQILWSKLVQRILLPKVLVSDIEIRDRLKQIGESLAQSEYSISEILLAPGQAGRRSLAKENAKLLVREIRKGTDFGVLARKFSDSNSASSGGDIGWQRIETLPSFVRSHLLKMEVGEVSDPIESPHGLYIIRVNEVRAIGDRNEGTEEVNLRRMFFRSSLKGSAGNRENFVRRIENIRKGISSCNEFDQVAKKAGFTGETKLGRLKLKELSSEIAKEIKNLPIGQPSLPIQVGENVTIFAVCQRSSPSPSSGRDQVRQKLLKEKLDIVARRFLRDMRANAIIDIRI